MSRKILLDTNLFIACFDEDGTTSAELRNSAKATLAGLLSDEDVALFITPLIRYEVLRGINWRNENNFLKVKEVLDALPNLELTKDICDLSANLYRYDSWLAAQPGLPPRNLEKRKLDIFHFCSAKCFGVDLYSNDTDIGKINRLHQGYLASLAANPQQ